MQQHEANSNQCNPTRFVGYVGVMSNKYVIL